MGLVMDHQQRQPKPCLINCPRCNSTNTKFCYYNNYSLSQPRHFCKACKRYWTRGGTLRNVPVGGGCRKNNNNRVIRRTQSSPAPNPLSSSSSPLVKPPAVSSASSNQQQVPQMGITLISASADGPKKDALTPLDYGLLGMSSGGYGDLIQPQQCSYSDMNVNSNNDPFLTGYNNHIVGSLGCRSLHNVPVNLQDKDLGTGPGTAGLEASSINQNDHLPQILFPLQAMLQQQSSTAIAKGHDPLAQRWNDNHVVAHNNQLQNDPGQNGPVYWISTGDSNVASWPPDHLPNTDG
ncbi:hypothetical protein QQ045_027951 [Rhodiola kirilowii]